MIVHSKSTTNSVEGTRQEELAVEHSNVHQADQNLKMSRIRLTVPLWLCVLQ